LILTKKCFDWCTYTELCDRWAETYRISMQTAMNAKTQHVLCYICLQTSQNSPNRAKQARTQQ